MRQKFRTALQSFKMLEPGDGVVLGISGGPDSMAMLALFQEISLEWQLKLYVVHLNHCFRGFAADQDEAYVVAYCREHDLSCHVFKRHVEQEAREMGLSFEEAGRLARYELFHQVMLETGSSRIAVAHNQNDQAETVLMRLMRGAGLEGLSAIPPVRDHIIRPLLHISRKEIEEFCKVEGIEARIDHTNGEDIYHRNSIRLTLMPLIEKVYNPSIVKRLSATADLIRDENAYMDGMADRALKEICSSFSDLSAGLSNENLEFEVAAFKDQPVALKRRILRKIIQNLAGSTRNVSAEQVEGLLQMIEQDHHGNQKNLKDIVFSIAYGKVSACRQDQPQNICGEQEIIVKIIDKSEWMGDKSGIYTMWMDEREICGNLSVRYRQEGDRFTPFGMSGSKKLKEFMIDEKIPQAKRGQIPLLCDEKGILWVYGYRASNRCKVNSDTLKVAKIELRFKKDISC